MKKNLYLVLTTVALIVGGSWLATRLVVNNAIAEGERAGKWAENLINKSRAASAARRGETYEYQTLYPSDKIKEEILEEGHWYGKERAEKRFVEDAFLAPYSNSYMGYYEVEEITNKVNELTGANMDWLTVDKYLFQSWEEQGFFWHPDEAYALFVPVGDKSVMVKFQTVPGANGYVYDRASGFEISVR